MSQTGWPSDRWTRNFLCLQCGHVYVYTALDVQWEKFLHEVQTPQTKAVDVVCFEIRCASQDCGAPLRFHAVVEIPLALSSRTLSLIDRATFHGICCEDGHLAEGNPGRIRGNGRLVPRLDDGWWSD